MKKTEKESTTKVKVGPRFALNLIKAGIINGRYEATISLIDDLLEQIPEDAKYCMPDSEESSGD